MTGNELFREIGNISEAYIVEAQGFQGKKLIRINAGARKTLAAAACFCVCVGLVFLIQKTGNGFDQAKKESIKEEAFDREMYQEESTVSENKTAQTREESVKFECAEDEKAVVDELTEEIAEIEAGNDAVAKQEETLKNNSIEDSYSRKNVKERLAQYSNDYQSLLKEEGALIVSRGNVKNGQDNWEAFMEQAAAGENAQVDVIVFTNEGDAIIKNIYFDGEAYHLCADKSRDAYAGVNAELYYEETFQYLECVETVLEDGTKVIEYVLTNELPAKELTEADGFTYSLYQIYQ